MLNVITFQNTRIAVCHLDGKSWLADVDIGRAIGCKNPLRDITATYELCKDELLTRQTQLCILGLPGDKHPIAHRVFSDCGAYIIAMNSSAPKALEFRRWVLGIFDTPYDPKKQLEARCSEEHIATLQKSALANDPKLEIYLEMARAGAIWPEVSERLQVPVETVREKENFLREIGFDVPFRDQPLHIIEDGKVWSKVVTRKPRNSHLN
jgi:prophage antirepressor-like protein